MIGQLLQHWLLIGPGHGLLRQLRGGQLDRRQPQPRGWERGRGVQPQVIWMQIADATFKYCMCFCHDDLCILL